MANLRALIFLRILATLALSFTPLTLVILSSMPAPPYYSPPEEFYQLNDEGFSFRWTSGAIADNLDCQLYELCTFADIKGPACPGELGLALEFYDSNGDLVTDGGDIISARGRGEFNAIEVGTSRDITFANFSVVGASCIKGVPTGKSTL
jgi:hypothetical protein